MRYSLLRIFLIVVIVCGGYMLFFESSPSANQSLEGEKKEPVVTMKRLSYKPINTPVIRSSALDNKVVIITFWATWCTPCINEIPIWHSLKTKYESEGLKIIAISIDQERKTVDQFLTRRPVRYPVVMATPEILKAYGEIRAVPTTFIINRKGEIVHKFLGYETESFFESQLLPLLKKENG